MEHVGRTNKWPSQFESAEKHLRAFLTGQRCMAIKFSGDHGLAIEALSPHMKVLHWTFQDGELNEIATLCDRLKVDVSRVREPAS